MKTVTGVCTVLVSSLLLLSLIPSGIHAEKESPALTVVYTEGYVDVKYAGTEKYVPLIEGKTIRAGDVIQTGDEGEVELTLPDTSVIKIGPSSRVVVKELGVVEVTKVTTSTFELIKGKIRAIVSPLMKKESGFFIETTNATVGVRGTDFGESYDPDSETTYLLALEDCVSLSLALFPGSVPFLVCGGNEMTVTGRGAPTPQSEAAPDVINRFLRDMELKGGKGGPGTGVRKPPYISGAFVNRTINLEQIDGSLTLTEDDLNLDNRAVVSGTAADDSGAVTLVEVSLDGGSTFERASGTEKWSFAFTPREDTEYTLMVRATNDAGLVSNPHDIGPWTIVYRNIDYEQVVRTFVESFLGALRTEDISTVRDLVSDGYDGSVGGYFSKDEMIHDGLEGLIGVLGGMTITYTLDQVNASGDKIVGVTRWAMLSGATHDQGTTKWWLSKSDDFRLVHAEGDWLLAALKTTPPSEPKLTLTVFTNGLPSPWCQNSVRILLTVPDVPISVTSVFAELQTGCEAGVVSLDRSYYESYTGKTDGFGGEIIMDQFSPACSVPNCPGNSIMVDVPPNNVFSCRFDDYGYYLIESILIP